MSQVVSNDQPVGFDEINQSVLPWLYAKVGAAEVADETQRIRTRLQRDIDDAALHATLIEVQQNLSLSKWDGFDVPSRLQRVLKHMFGCQWRDVGPIDTWDYSGTELRNKKLSAALASKIDSSNLELKKFALDGVRMSGYVHLSKEELKKCALGDVRMSDCVLVRLSSSDGKEESKMRIFMPVGTWVEERLQDLSVRINAMLQTHESPLDVGGKVSRRSFIASVPGLREEVADTTRAAEELKASAADVEAAQDGGLSEVLGEVDRLLSLQDDAARKMTEWSKAWASTSRGAELDLAIATEVAPMDPDVTAEGADGLSKLELDRAIEEAERVGEELQERQRARVPQTVKKTALSKVTTANGTVLDIGATNLVAADAGTTVLCDALSAAITEFWNDGYTVSCS